MNNRILVADDDASVLAALNMLLKSQGFEVSAVTTPQALIEQVKTTEFSAALIDLNYQDDTTSGKEGLSLIQEIKALEDTLPIIVMTGYSSVDIAVEAMKLGASDFIQKPWSNERLLHSIRTQIKLHSQLHANAKLTQQNTLLTRQAQPPVDEIIAKSDAMQSLLAQLSKLAQSDMSILLTGENGTGKSMLAQYIHKQSARKNASFIAVNMGAISESLFESEMFGHIKGAFTDAKDTRIGRFELAQSGTIFLDEIANIGTAQQAKLLRVLEERQFEKVGSSKTQSLDLRIISATNADIQGLIDNNQFRQDLLYRLNTIAIHIPPLRERLDDIEHLANAFIHQYAEKYRFAAGELSVDAINALKHYHWPGNIRELGHVIERAMFLRQSDVIEAQELGLPGHSAKVAEAQKSEFDASTLDELEKTVIQKRLAIFDNNPQKTADSLGLSRSAYYRRLEKYQLLDDDTRAK
jgi:DNA-binding NtrC family response regulator